MGTILKILTKLGQSVSGCKNQETASKTSRKEGNSFYNRKDFK